MEFDFSQQPGLTRWNKNLVNTDKPLVSIITPFYNGGKYIQQTCNCVLDQTFPYFEWVIVDDGSTKQEDLEILDGIAKLDPRIRVLHKENGGPSVARNYAVHHAVTDLILPLDCDDLIEPTFIEYCWWMLQKNPEATWAYTNSLGFGEMEYLWHVKFNPIQMKTENLLSITALIRKDAFLSIGSYSEEVKLYNEDWESWLKLIAKGCYPAQSTGEYQFWYRRSNSGVQSSIQGNKKRSQVNKGIIAAAADLVKDPKAPVIYPSKFSFDWAQPKMSDWDKCVYAKKEKKHVAFLVPHMVMGGSDKFNLDLMTGLKDKFELSLLTTIPSENEWLQRFRKVTPNIFNLANFVDPADFAEFISYYIKSRQVDVLFVSNSYHGYYLIPWLREHFPELPIVDYVHMEEWYWRQGGYARASGMLGAVTEKTYVCNSATRDVLIEKFGRAPESVETVYIGVDERYFCRDGVQSGQLYQELGLAENRPIVLFICRLHPQKRPFLMLEIAKKVAQKVPEVAFAVVGDGPQEKELRNKAADMHLSENVYFLGARKDVRGYYRDAKATLVCSLKEGLSLTAYESCAMGVPVVSADVGGQRDLVDEAVGKLIPCAQSEADAFDNRQFPEGEVDAYVDALVELLTDDNRWASASETCRSRVEAGFTIQKMVDYFKEELVQIMEDASMKEKRIQVSNALKLCSPLAADLFIMEMQMHCELEKQYEDENLTYVQKALRVLRKQGPVQLLKKVLRVLKRKLLHR